VGGGEGFSHLFADLTGRIELHLTTLLPYSPRRRRQHAIYIPISSAADSLTVCQQNEWYWGYNQIGVHMMLPPWIIIWATHNSTITISTKTLSQPLLSIHSRTSYKSTKRLLWTDAKNWTAPGCAPSLAWTEFGVVQKLQELVADSYGNYIWLYKSA
jgi:hypothetical protein